MKPEVIVRVPFPPESIALLEEDFTVYYAPTLPELEKAIREHGATTRAVIGNGSIGLTGDQIRSIPNLEMIHTVGVGYEKIDMEAVKEKKIILATNAGTNAFSVAEQALGLLLAVLRDIPAAERAVRSGIWEEARYPRPLIFEKRVGIIGLGEVGLGIAKRLEPFEATVLYHNRRPREGVSYQYCATPLELATASDILIISCPGGDETRHIVNRDVLAALGPSGVVINVGRGSVVDTGALVDALHGKVIAGAGLDVWEGEPEISPALAGAPNVILSPHIGGRSPEAIVFARRQIAENLKAHFFGDGNIVHRIV